MSGCPNLMGLRILYTVFTAFIRTPKVVLMDDLRFYVLFNSISVISRQWVGDNESCMQWNPVYDRKDSRL